MLQSLFAKKPSKSGVVAVALLHDGIALARVSDIDTLSPTLHTAEFIACSSSERKALLSEKVHSLGWQHMPCRLCLGFNDYQWLLTEAPKVPEAELANALRFKIKDLVSTPLDSTVLSAVSLPNDSQRGGDTAMAYVAAADRAMVADAIELINDVDLELLTIDIAEMAQRNLLCLASPSDRAQALVSFSQGQGRLLIARAGNVYLSRKFTLDYNAGLLDDLPEDALILELQRSLDYFERQMRQVPPRQVFFTGENISPDKITEGLQSAFSAEIGCLDFVAKLTIESAIADHSIELAQLAVGAALRNGRCLYPEVVKVA